MACSRLLIGAFDSDIYQKFWISDNIPVDSHAEYSASATYAVDAEVKFENRIFKSAKEDNIGNTPIPFKKTLAWIDIGAINERRYLDGKRSNRSVNSATDESMVIEYKADGIGYISLAGLVGNSCKIELIDTRDDSAIAPFPETIQLGTQWVIMNDFDLLYPYATWEGVTKYFKSVPVRYNQKLRITITPSSEGTGLGLLNIGRLDDIGLVMYGSTLSASPSEIVTRDLNNDTATEETNGVIRLSVPIGIEETNPNQSQLNLIKNKLIAYRGKPITVIGENIEGFGIFGMYRDVVIPMDNAYYNVVNLIIDSLE